MGLFARVRDWFRPTEVRPIPLSFEMDVQDDGRHVVRVYRDLDGGQIPVEDVDALLRYDYREVASDSKVLQVLSEEDRQTLLALDSLNPERLDGHTLVFEITPPVLQYLRRKPVVHESEQANEIVISDKPLKPVVNISYDPAKGATVQAGYQLDGVGEVVPHDAAHRVGNSDYVRIGKRFVPLPRGLSTTAQNLLSSGTKSIPLAQIPEFFARDLVLIKKEFMAVLTDLAQQIRVIEDRPEPIVRVNKDTPGWLRFNVEYSAGDVAWAHNLLVRKSPSTYQQLDDTTWIKTDSGQLTDVERKLAGLGAATDGDGYRLPISHFASLEEFIDAIGGTRALSADYQAFIDQLTGFRANAAFPLAMPVERQLTEHHIQLRPYQREGIHWLTWLAENRLHGLLADDMGLGKTMQTICAMAHTYHTEHVEEHSLIIAPKSVLIHWRRELHRCMPHADVELYHGQDRARIRPRFTQKRPTIFISTYATIANDLDYISQVPFFYLILDEATNIKNPNARRTQAIKAINAAHRIALSGTPIENRPAELWSLFDFLMRNHLGRYGTFQSRFENPILAGDSRAADALGRRIRPFMLRRRKEEVAKDLPEKLPVIEWCELSEEQRNLYGALQGTVQEIRAALGRGETVNYTTSILPVITKLKQICDHPALVSELKQPIANRSQKFDRIVSKIKEILENREQVVIFSHFIGMLNLLQQEVARFGVPYIRIDGSTSNRQKWIDLFNRGAAPVALCSLMAAGHGITLTAANHVIHADRWWNPAVEDQATDRVHRIGQTKTVYVYHFLTEGTLEETIDELLERKRDMADQVVEAAEKVGMAWSREELIEILRPLR